jgi:hypothetical protein
MFLMKFGQFSVLKRGKDFKEFSRNWLPNTPGRYMAASGQCCGFSAFFLKEEEVPMMCG